MTREEQIRKIQGCLAMTRSTFPAEAEDALLMAQKLMAKWHIEESEVNEEMKAENVVTKTNWKISVLRPWVRQLGTVIASNFKCKFAIVTGGRVHRGQFIGYEMDAEVALQVFEMAFNYAERIAENKAQTYNDKGLSAKGVKLGVQLGFVSGLEAAYREQVVKDQSLELMIIVPHAVEEYTKDWKAYNGGFKSGKEVDYDAYQYGQQEGREYAGRTGIEEKGTQE